LSIGNQPSLLDAGTIAIVAKRRAHAGVGPLICNRIGKFASDSVRFPFPLGEADDACRLFGVSQFELDRCKSENCTQLDAQIADSA
jgi:hypothetical protein